MICPHCGANNEDGGRFCTECGTRLEAPAPRSATPPPNYGSTASNRYNLTADQLPLQYRPLGAWAYFGYSLLFALPLVGFICLIIFSFNDDNINRRNYARSFWCALLVSFSIMIVLLVLALVFGASRPDVASATRSWL